MKKSIPLMTNITHKILSIRFIKLWKHPCWIIGIEAQRLPHTTEGLPRYISHMNEVAEKAYSF
jgi:hypothetical protein